ncbi:hypothetical protein BH18ACT4_BH18ACT4_01030 [soil metagenome]
MTTVGEVRAQISEKPAGRVVAVVPHTHWDREWYAPFQTFRLRLVDLLDDLLPQLDTDPAYAHFMLDGQMAVVDDYLEVRPEAEGALRRLAASGRLGMGPWYVLMDEFLVSGETIVRNLQLGLDRATEFAGAMEVGYLPDMFGHVAQMPQLLRQFGFDHAVVWRGVPTAVDRSGFWWGAPDGSTVRAAYLPQGYGNGANVPDDAAALIERIVEFDAQHKHMLVGPVLWMNGTDHLEPQRWLGRVVTEANEIQDEYRVEVCSLASYLASAPVDGLPAWTGELRSGARANLLMGVASNRVDVKQAAARAERELERRAEPLSALFSPPEEWPEALLRTAWLEVIRNSAHDSICACSADPVADAVLHRYGEATSIAEGLTERALARLGTATAGAGPIVVNPASRTRSGLVELVVAGGGEVEGTQTLSVREVSVVLQRSPSAALAAGLVAELEYVRRYSSAAIHDADGAELFRATRVGASLIGSNDRAALMALLTDHRPREVIVTVTQEPGRTVLARVDDLAGYGWRDWSPGPLGTGPVRAGSDGRSLTNGLAAVEVDPVHGTFSIDGHHGMGRLVDGGDAGDTYNWCPPADDVEVDRPETTTVRVLEEGPLRGRLEITSSYRWPTRADARNRRGEACVDVRTTLELRAGERLVRITVDFDNRVRDHRLRAWFPLPVPATTSRAECAFAVVERGLVAEGGPTEPALATFPSRRFVCAGGLTIVHEGLLEYELVDVQDGVANALALTLVRCTGMLSQGPMPTRPLPAGPMTPLEGPQLQRRLSLRYAVVVGDEVDPYAAVDDAFVPLLVTAAGGGDGPRVGQALSVAGAEVSALRRTQSGLVELRVFNPRPAPTTVTVEGRSGSLVDLRGRPVGTFADSFPLGPWRLATAILDDAGASH